MFQDDTEINEPSNGDKKVEMTEMEASLWLRGAVEGTNSKSKKSHIAPKQKFDTPTVKNEESEVNISVRSKGRAAFAPWRRQTEKVQAVTPKFKKVEAKLEREVSGSSAKFRVNRLNFY